MEGEKEIETLDWIEMGMKEMRRMRRVRLFMDNMYVGDLPKFLLLIDEIGRRGTGQWAYSSAGCLLLTSLSFINFHHCSF